jgi:hypothetical protein
MVLCEWMLMRMPAGILGLRFCASRASWVLTACLLLDLLSPGCTTIRVTDPPRTADEQFLMSTAASQAVAQLSVDALRDRKIWIETRYINAPQQQVLFNTTPVHGTGTAGPEFNTPEQAFVVGELRARLLLGGVRLVAERDQADIVLEVRSGGVGINRTEYLIGIPSIPLPGISTATSTAAEFTTAGTPEVELYKNERQRGFAGVAFVAYWRDTGELVTSSGPFIGRTARDDFFILGAAARSVGNIPPTDSAR